MRKQMKMEPCTLCRGTGPSTMCQCEMTLMLRHKGNAKMDCSWYLLMARSWRLQQNWLSCMLEVLHGLVLGLATVRPCMQHRPLSVERCLSPGGPRRDYYAFQFVFACREVFGWMRIEISSGSCVFRGRELRFGADSWKTRFPMKILRNQIMRPAGRIFVIWFLKFVIKTHFCHESAPNRSSRPLNTQLPLEISIRTQWKTSQKKLNSPK